MRIICVSGTRADYGIFRPLLLEMNKDTEIDLSIIATGMHLLYEYGHTIDEIKQDKLKIIDTPSVLFKGDNPTAMSQSVGMATLYFANTLAFHEPDYVLLLGDRGEMLAAALAAHYQNIRIIHLHGGERSGSADDAIRHCLSKLADIHFVSSKAAQQYLVQLGEEKRHIFHTGSLRKTEIIAVQKKSKQLQLYEELSKRLPFVLHQDRSFVVLTIHPDTKETCSPNEQISSVVKAIAALDCLSRQIDLLIIGANSDAGGELFNHTLREFAAKDVKHRTYISSIRSELFLYVLSQADLLVGNTSSGIIEAPFFQLPFVNIGQRQINREQGNNVFKAGYDQQEIVDAIKKALAKDRSLLTENPYDAPGIPEHKMISLLRNIQSN